MASVGLPIVNDPLYPEVVDVAPDDITGPLALLARSLEFTDPVSGRRRTFISARNVITDDPARPTPRRSPRDFDPLPSEALS